MHWYGSGFITIINYSAGARTAEDDFAIRTETNIDILTEGSLEILTENATH